MKKPRKYLLTEKGVMLSLFVMLVSFIIIALTSTAHSEEYQFSNLYTEVSFSKKEYLITEGDYLNDNFTDLTTALEIGIESYPVYSGIGIETGHFNDRVFFTTGMNHIINSEVSGGLNVKASAYDNDTHHDVFGI